MRGGGLRPQGARLGRGCFDTGKKSSSRMKPMRMRQEDEDMCHPCEEEAPMRKPRNPSDRTPEEKEGIGQRTYRIVRGARCA